MCIRDRPQVSSTSHSLADGLIGGCTGNLILHPMQSIQTESQVGIPPAGWASQDIPFTEKSREFTGQAGELQWARHEEHVRKTWMQWQVCHLSSMGGDLSACLKCPHGGEQRSCLSDGSGRR